MHQLQIEYFFPLTEQIPLDLDYSVCEKPNLYTTPSVTCGTGLTFSSVNNSWSTVTINGSQLNLDVEQIEFKLKEKPNFMRRIMYKVMGLKWKIK